MLLTENLYFRAQLKSYVRDNNTSFNLTEVRRLAAEWMAALDPDTSASYLEHARSNEDVFKQADNFVEEEIEPELDEDNYSLYQSDSDSDNDENSL